MKRLSQFLAACQSKAGRRRAGWGAVPGACSGPAHLTHLRGSSSEDSAVNTKGNKPCPPGLTVQWKENDVSTGLPHDLSTQHRRPLLRSRRARGPPRSTHPFDNQGQKRTQVSVFCLPGSPLDSAAMSQHPVIQPPSVSSQHSCPKGAPGLSWRGWGGCSAPVGGRGLGFGVPG